MDRHYDDSFSGEQFSDLCNKWNNLCSEKGQFKSVHQGGYYQESVGYSVCCLEVTFERGIAYILVFINNQNKVAKISFDPKSLN